MFFHKFNRHSSSEQKQKTSAAIYADTWDRTVQKPVIRSSICTGEKVAGFKNLSTGKFEDIMLIRNDADMKSFLKLYGVSPEEITKEW